MAFYTKFPSVMAIKNLQNHLIFGLIFLKFRFLAIFRQWKKRLPGTWPAAEPSPCFWRVTGPVLRTGGRDPVLVAFFVSQCFLLHILATLLQGVFVRPRFRDPACCWSVNWSWTSFLSSRWSSVSSLITKKMEAKLQDINHIFQKFKVEYARNSFDNCNNLLSQLKVILLLLLLSFPIFFTKSAPIWACSWEFRALATFRVWGDWFVFSKLLAVIASSLFLLRDYIG